MAKKSNTHIPKHTDDSHDMSVLAKHNMYFELDRTWDEAKKISKQRSTKNS